MSDNDLSAAEREKRKGNHAPEANRDRCDIQAMSSSHPRFSPRRPPAADTSPSRDENKAGQKNVTDLSCRSAPIAHPACILGGPMTTLGTAVKSRPTRATAAFDLRRRSERRVEDRPLVRWG